MYTNTDRTVGLLVVLITIEPEAVIASVSLVCAEVVAIGRVVVERVKQPFEIEIGVFGVVVALILHALFDLDEFAALLVFEIIE